MVSERFINCSASWCLYLCRVVRVVEGVSYSELLLLLTLPPSSKHILGVEEKVKVVDCVKVLRVARKLAGRTHVGYVVAFELEPVKFQEGNKHIGGCFFQVA